MYHDQDQGGPASSQVEERDNRIYWTVWIRWPGTSDPQKYTALVDTGAQCTLIPSSYVGTESTVLEAKLKNNRYQSPQQQYTDGKYRTDRDSVTPIHEMIRKLESQGVVSKARSPFNSPIWPVCKSSGEWRLTMDYRALNEVTPPLSAAVPDMLELQYELESKAAKCETFGLSSEEEEEQVTRANEDPPYNELLETGRQYALFTDGSCQVVGANQKWKAAVWNPTRRIPQVIEGQRRSSQVADLRAIQLALDIAQQEKWPGLCLYTDS
ncbi:hypothetical protein DUI87_26359 [Hirundo rustica rustica]|uniref:RNase H type-1 domain-containing protein n=1 Tax=Hirundo rustica rustica TaxID=333673 RepID=A0A3M0JQJ4_HIRRU|nr:hypothetical protein DUI87_26359 [Hirundo rustica rustica]